jgi:hypothetical protein
MATSVTMPTIIVIPIIAEMLSSIPVSQSPQNTAGIASNGIASIDPIRCRVAAVRTMHSHTTSSR